MQESGSKFKKNLKEKSPQAVKSVQMGLQKAAQMKLAARKSNPNSLFNSKRKLDVSNVIDRRPKGGISGGRKNITEKA